MNRRGFLKAIFAGAAAVALPVTAARWVAPELFRLSGGGIHNDAPALQALIDGKEVIGPGGEILKGKMEGGVWTVRIPAGVFRLGAVQINNKTSLVGAH